MIVACFILPSLSDHTKASIFMINQMCIYNCITCYHWIAYNFLNFVPKHYHSFKLVQKIPFHNPWLSLTFPSWNKYNTHYIKRNDNILHCMKKQTQIPKMPTIKLSVSPFEQITFYKWIIHMTNLICNIKCILAPQTHNTHSSI